MLPIGRAIFAPASVGALNVFQPVDSAADVTPLHIFTDGVKGAQSRPRPVDVIVAPAPEPGAFVFLNAAQILQPSRHAGVGFVVSQLRQHADTPGADIGGRWIEQRAVVGEEEGELLLVLLARWKSPEIYDIVIIHMTERWYSEVLGRLEAGQRVLDVGIGTGGALCTPANAALVATKRLKIVGIDYEERYIAKARASSASAGLSEALKVHCASVYDPSLPEMVGTDFDCACARPPAPSPAAAPRLASAADSA